MSWGTEFKAEILLPRITVNSVLEANVMLEGFQAELDAYMEAIKMYAISSPSEIVCKEWEDQVVDYVRNKVNDELLQIRELVFTITLLELYINNKERNSFSSEND